MGGELTATSPWCESGAPGALFSFVLELEAHVKAHCCGGTQPIEPLHEPLLAADAAAAPCRAPSRPAASAPAIRPAPALAAPALAAAAPSDARPPMRGSLPPDLRVLLVDDVPMNLKILQYALSVGCGTDWRIVKCLVSDEAVKVFAGAAASADPFAIVIMDEHFKSGQLRGSEAIRRIRALEEAAAAAGAAQGAAPGAATSRAVIITCTGNTGSGHDEEDRVYYDAGADAVWGKPIPSWTDGTMQASLEQLLRLHRAPIYPRLQ